MVPAPGLDRLPDLVVGASAGGVTVDLDVTMTATPPAGVQAAAYRIVEEALTNVVKHAAPAHCTVGVAAGPHTVDIDVTDDGPPAAVSAGGHGLVGMRERAALYGGEFRADPRPGGGFAVTARLPYVRTGGGGVIRVVIAEDQALVRRGFRLLVDSAADMTTVGEAATRTSSRRCCRRR